MKKTTVFLFLVAFLGVNFYVSGPGVAEAQNVTFSVNDRVQVVVAANAKLKVRQYPSNTSQDLGGQDNRALGTVVAGPTYDAGGTAYWNVNFDENPDGWVSGGSSLIKFQPKFAKDDKVKALVNSLKVRREPSLAIQVREDNSLQQVDNVLTTVYLGNEGKVLADSLLPDPYYQDGYIWWKINWGRYCPNGILSCTDLVGWSAETATDGTAYLAKVTASSNTNVPPPNAGGDFTLNPPVTGATYQKGTNLPVNWGTLPIIGYYSPVGITVKLVGPYSDPTTSPSERVIITRGSEVNPNNSPSYVSGGGWIITSDVKNGLYVVKATASYSGNGSNRNSVSGTFTISDSTPGGDPGGDPGQNTTARFVSPVGGETWQKGQTKALGWDTPLTWNVSEVTLSLTDVNGSHVSPIAIVKDNVPLSIQGGSDFNWTIPTSIADGTYKIRATVNRRDTNLTTAFLSNQFTISGQTPPGGTNQPPVISGVSGPTSLTVNQSGSWTISATDPNGDALTYSVSWGDGSGSPSQSGSSFSHTYSVSGNYGVVFSVADGRGETATYNLTVAVTSQGGNATSTSAEFAVGNAVAMPNLSGQSIEVRIGPITNDGPAGGFVTTFGAGIAGIVQEGPIRDKYNRDWYKVDFRNGPARKANGWVADPELTKITSWNYDSSGNFAMVFEGGGSYPYYYYLEGLGGSMGYPLTTMDSVTNTDLPFDKALLTNGAWQKKNEAINATPFTWGTLFYYKRGANLSPVITSFTGPTNSVVGVQGSWQFIATDPEGALASYEIDWGDSTTKTTGQLSGASATKNETHTYQTAGNYNVSLKVFDSAGLSATASAQAAVTAPCSTRFQVGDRVKVSNLAENGLNVRSTPAGSLAGTQQRSSEGLVIGGPRSAASGGVDYCWWQVNYDSGADGWSAEKVGNEYMLDKVSGAGGGQADVSGSLAQGGVLNISWSMPSNVTKVHLYLSNYGVIALNVPNTGSYTWNVPADVPVRDDYTVIVYSAETGVTLQQVSSPFSLTPQGGSGGLSGGLSGGVVGNFLVCDIVRPTTVLNVRSSEGLGNNVIGQQTPDFQGVIKEGPVAANEHTWWKVDFSYGVDGWLAEAYLELVQKGNCPPPNQPPIINSFTYTGQTAPPVNTNLPFQVKATDPEGSSITYEVEWGDGSAGSFSEASGVVVNFSHSYTQAGSYTVRVTALDTQGLSVSANVPITVSAASQSQAPVLGAISGPTQLSVNTQGSWQVSATDANSPSLTYTVSWGDGSQNSTYTGVSGQNVSLTHTYTSAGNKTITVTASDGQSSDTETLAVSIVTGPVSNQSPSIVSLTGNTSVPLNTAGNWFVRASDPNGDALTYAVTWGDGNSNNYNGASGQEVKITHTYTVMSSNAGIYSFKVVVTDGKGGRDEENYTVNVNASQGGGDYPPSRPVIAGPTQVVAGTSGSWQITFNDLDSSSLTYTIDWRDGTAPVSGSVISGQTISVSHTYMTVNRYQSLLVTVSDGKSTESASPFINVTAAPQPPTINSLTGPTEIGTGVTGLWTITATDSEGGTLTYNAVWGDGNSSHSGASGQATAMSHTYNQAGNFTVQVTALSARGLSASQSLAVQAKVVNPNSGVSTKFNINDRVEVIPDNSNLAMRAMPKTGGFWIKGRNAVNRGGARGAVVGGPVAADGYNWWLVKWDDNFTGWSAENWLQKVPTAPVNTVTIRVGAYAPLFTHPELPPKGGVGSNDAYYKSISPLVINGRTWTWISASALWKLTAGPDLTITY